MGRQVSSCSETPRRWARLNPAQRAERLAMGVTLALAMAATPLWLERHIGPGCAFRAVTGLPCPLCGGTHACAAWVQGDWSGAWAANPGAVGLLVWMGLAAAQWGMEGLLGGRRVRPWPWARPAALQAVVAGLLVSWVVRLVS